MRGILVILFCAVISIKSYPQHPSDLGPCRQDDKICINSLTSMIYKQSIIGEPSLNIENLDPVYQEEVVANLAMLKYKLLKSYLHGFQKCDIRNSNLNLHEGKMSLEMHCPHLTLNGDYEIDGHLLETWYIQGAGDYNIDAKDYRLMLDTDIKVIRGDDGRDYMTIETFSVQASVHGGLNFDLRNLFNGNKELGDAVLQFMNQNWKLVADQLQGPTFDANIKQVMKNFNKFLKLRPLDTLIVL